MSQPDSQSANGSRSYNYSIPSLAPKSPPAPLRFDIFIAYSALNVAVFLLAGLLLLPLTGFQTDEVMFVYDLWHPDSALSRIGVHHHFLPSMMMPYLGALKSWIYLPILGALGYSRYAVRLPMLLLAAVTILLTGRLLQRLQGKTAATVAVVLLSTDVVFLVTSVFDWGPVVVQNFLLVTGLLAILKWYDGKRDQYAFLAGLAFGLAFWNKALFIWNFAGLLVAVLIMGLPLLVRAWRWPAAGLFVVALLIGASPLLKYNLQSRGGTLKSTDHLTTSGVGDKAWYFALSLNGETAANVDLQNTNPDRVMHPLSHAAGWLSSRFSNPPSSWRFPAGVLVLVLGLITANGTQRRWIAFFLISGFVGWLQSALTPDAGRSIHHTVLFWLNWYASVALAFGCLAAWRSAAAKRVVAGGVALLALGGAMTMFADYGALLLHSATTPWTDADAALAAKLSALGARQVLTADWGIADVLALRSRDQISVTEEVFNLNGGSFDRDQFAACKAPDCYVVTHVPEKVMLAKASAFLQQGLKDNGFAIGAATTISDTHGTPTFLVFPTVVGATQTAQENTPLPLPTVSHKPVLIATPAVILTTGQTGRTTLTWQIPANMFVEVHVDAPDGALFASSKGPSQEQTGFWVKNGTQFFLQDVSDGKARSAENTVGHVRVEVRPR